MLRLHYCAVVISAFVLVVTNCAAQTPATKSGSRGLPTDYGMDVQSALLEIYHSPFICIKAWKQLSGKLALLLERKVSLKTLGL